MASLRNPEAYALNVQLRIAERNIDEQRLVSGITCLTNNAHCSMASQSGFQWETGSIRKKRFATQYRLTRGGNCRAGRSGSIKASRNCIGVDQIGVTLEPNRRGQRRFARPIRAAITVSVGILPERRYDLTQNLLMRLSGGSGMQKDLKPPSVGQFLNIPAEIVHKDDRMTSGQGIPASTKTGRSRSLCKLVGENVGGRHNFISSIADAAKPLPGKIAEAVTILRYRVVEVRKRAVNAGTPRSYPGFSLAYEIDRIIVLRAQEESLISMVRGLTAEEAGGSMGRDQDASVPQRVEISDVNAMRPMTMKSACTVVAPRMSIRILTIARLTDPRTMQLMGRPG